MKRCWCNFGIWHWYVRMIFQEGRGHQSHLPDPIKSPPEQTDIPKDASRYCQIPHLVPFKSKSIFDSCLFLFKQCWNFVWHNLEKRERLDFREKVDVNTSIILNKAASFYAFISVHKFLTFPIDFEFFWFRSVSVKSNKVLNFKRGSRMRAGGSSV